MRASRTVVEAKPPTALAMMAEPVLRDTRYLETYGCYPRRAVVELEASEKLDAKLTRFKLLRLVFSEEESKQTFLEEPEGQTWSISFKEPTLLEFSFELNPGYYLLFASGERGRFALPIVVDDRERPASVAVIRPTFTQWSYHAEGFYHNDYRSQADRVLMSVGYRGGRAGRLMEGAMRKTARTLKLPKVNFPYTPFPANASINLNGFYRRNNRWDRLMWDETYGRLEGLWVDEVISGMPVFALLEKNAVPYHVYTDVDLHNRDPRLERYRVLIFSGQEGITRDYYTMLESLQARGETSFLLWGVQAFGYRQLDYDARSGELSYVATRGQRGMWGDALTERQPDWADESRLFGFHFPEPQSATWRYDKPYSRIVVHDREHAIVSASNHSETYHFEVRDRQGETHTGLTWAGGEVQERVDAEARVIAYLDDDREIIGIGEYRNTIIFSPTYLPAFFAYQSAEHPEIEAWLMAALSYLTRKNA